MAELFNQATTLAAANTGTPINVALPDSLSDGTLLILLVVVDDDAVNITTPTGWTRRYGASGSGSGGNPASFAWFYRVNDGTVTAPSVGVSGACNAIAVLLEWGGYDPLQPVPADVSGANWVLDSSSPLSVRSGWALNPTADGVMISLAYSSLELRDYAVESGGVLTTRVQDEPRELLVAHKPGVTIGSEPDILVSFTEGGVHLVSNLLIVSGPAGLQSLPRIRSHVSEDAGSLFQATQAVAVEAAVSEAFPYGTAVSPARFMAYREALTPDQLALRYHPIPTRNQEMLVTVEGETNLGRMARVYPAPIITRVADIPGHSGGAMTAQEAISYVFSRWAEEFPWFEFEPVPDLRLLVPEAVAAPRQHYLDNPEAGVITVEAIVIPQEGDDRRTMREVVDEWLSVFPGTIVRQNSSGRIELVPRVGPDAPDDAAVTLGWRDIISMSDGEDDPRGVVNRARCVSQGWTFEEDQALTPPLHVLGLRSDGLQESALEEVVDDLTSERLVDGGAREFETFAEPDKPLTIEWRFRVFTAGTPTSTSLTTEVDLNGSFQMQQTAELEVSWFIFGVDNEKTRVRFTRQGNGIRARFDQSGRWRFGPNPFVGTRYAAYVLEFGVAGTGWARANEQIVGEFSSSNGDFLPDVDDSGQNALEVSESLFGEREATIRSDVFQLMPEQAQAVAQGYVLHNINPRTVREVQQSEWNRYPVKFDHVGRLVDLPNGERAVIENRSYSDSFAPDGGFMQSAFTATVQELVIDTTTEYLFLDNGEFMRLDDGTLVEAS